MVASNNEFELGDEGERVLPHKTGGYRVTSGDTFDPRFGPTPALLGLVGRHHASTAKDCKFSRVAIDGGNRKRLHGRHATIITHDAGEGVQQRALAVGAGAVT